MNVNGVEVKLYGVEIVMTCMKCKARTANLYPIMMSCKYDMYELEIPFSEKQIGFYDNGLLIPHFFYTIHVCQICRSLWLEMIKNWFNDPIRILSDVVEGSGIFVRINGVMQEVSEEKWEQLYPGSIPLRVKKHD